MENITHTRRKLKVVFNSNKKVDGAPNKDEDKKETKKPALVIKKDDNDKSKKKVAFTDSSIKRKVKKSADMETESTYKSVGTRSKRQRCASDESESESESNKDQGTTNDSDVIVQAGIIPEYSHETIDDDVTIKDLRRSTRKHNKAISVYSPEKDATIKRNRVNDEKKNSKKLKKHGESSDEDYESSDKKVMAVGNSKPFGIRTRSTPHQLYKTVNKLSENQKNATRKIGYGSFLSMKVDGLPAQLAHYVVDKFDPLNMEINTGSVKISVISDTIHKLIGVPNNGVILEDTPIKSRFVGVLKEWRSRYPSATIKPTEIADMTVMWLCI